MSAFFGVFGPLQTLQQTFPGAVKSPQERAKFLQKFSGITPMGAHPNDLAYEQYKQISLDNYMTPDGQSDTLAWYKDRQAYLHSLPPKVQDYVVAREAANKTGLEKVYDAAVQKYMNFELQNRQGAELYHQLYSGPASANPRTQALFERQNPEVRIFIRRRLQFMRQHPDVAIWFLHGRHLATDLRLAGLSPTASPADQLAQLNPGVDLFAPAQGPGVAAGLPQ